MKTAKQISDEIIAAWEAEFGHSISTLRRAVFRVFARVFAGVITTLYHFAAWCARQMFPQYADANEVSFGGVSIVPLDAWGEVFGISRKPGTAAIVDATVTVLQTGGTLLAGTQYVHPETGTVYEQTADVPLTASQVTVSCEALNIGAIGTRNTGDTLAFVAAPADVAKDAVVVATTTPGADEESDDAYRTRIVERFAAHPQGGALADYRQWAESVTGVARAYPYSSQVQAGLVEVYIESADDPDGIAPPALIDEVKEAIELDDAGIASRRPISDKVEVYSITRQAIDVTIIGLIAPSISEAQQAITDALSDYFLSREPWLPGVAVPPRKDTATASEVGGIAARIASSFGGTVFSATMAIGGAPTPSVTVLGGSKLKLGTITWA